MKALVVGATGETGRRIVQSLIHRQIPVRACVRDAEKAKAIWPDGMEVVVADVLNPTSLQSAINGCTVIICATGAAPSFDPTLPYRVDFLGTQNLVDAAKKQGVDHFVLVSSLCVSQFFHPLNLFWLILVWKQKAEAYVQKSGLKFTIVRPGGLKNEDDNRGICMQAADTLFEGSIPRAKVAEVCVEALFQPAASNKIVEVVAEVEQIPRPLVDLFASIV